MQDHLVLNSTETHGLHTLYDVSGSMRERAWEDT